MQTNDWKSVLSNLITDAPKEENEDTKEETSKPQEMEKQSVRIEMDKSGRAGKKATIIYGFTCSEEDVKKLASELKKKFSSGGSARGLEILIQGDMRTQISEYLQKKGHKTRVI